MDILETLLVNLILRASMVISLLVLGSCLVIRDPLPVEFESSPLHCRQDLFELEQYEIVVWILVKPQPDDIVKYIY